MEHQLNIKSLLSNLVLISATIASQAALAECKTVMGGCVPAENLADLPSHMKSQIVNKVTRQPAATPVKASGANNNKTGVSTLALANSTK